MKTVPIELEKINVGNDSFTGKRSSAKGKYEALFDALRPGMCLRMPAEYVPKIAHALDSWIEKQGKNDEWMARSCRNYANAKIGETGRVWLMPRKEEKPETKKLKRVA